ncbi:hypothetical protein HRbin29_01823 [bacterium HR29]|jgi:hypothetical protein|nr:hypothetical protein HRbin29_01823 [bacterium HR29]
MRLRLVALFAALALAVVVSAPVAAASVDMAHSAPSAPAQETGGHGEARGGDASGVSANTERILWSVLAIALAVPIAGVFYLLKKRLRAFPENPEWVAPISVMRSRDLPDEHTYEGGEAAGTGHGHH